MTEEMLNYYTSLGFRCFVIKCHQRMDGSYYATPGLFYSKDGLIDCVNYFLFDREDIRMFLKGNYNFFNSKYESKCKEIFDKQYRKYANNR